MYTLEQIIGFFPASTINGLGEKSPDFYADTLFVCRGLKVLAVFDCTDFIPDEDGEPDEPLYSLSTDDYVGKDLDDLLYDIMDAGMTLNTLHDGDDSSNSDLVTEVNEFYVMMSALDEPYTNCFVSETDLCANANEVLYHLADCAGCFEDGDCSKLAERINRTFVAKKHYVVIFDNLVTDDVIVQHYYESNIFAVDSKAYEYSKRTGLSLGNYEIFEEVR